MPKTDARARFSLSGPRFLALEAFAGTGNLDRHLTWFASFDEAGEEDGSRVVVATLHAAEDDASATVTIAGSLFWGGGAAEPKTRKKLAQVIRESYALATMYDMARTQVQALLAIAQLEMDLPLEPPLAEVHEFSERPDSAHPEEPQDDRGSDVVRPA
ncbi:hypothetical protein [Specibacter sp. NPDC078692]|uniref:hypothetical protein n=1 Tax=Specibacter sp. NPDC078692 TaxID=3155818 RepID=UPI00343EDC80